MKKQILLIAHTPSNNLQALAQAFSKGMKNADTENIELIHRAPLAADETELLQASAVVLLTPENLSYMSGALKDWFDRIYYPALDQTQGLPCCAIIRAGSDGTGTEQALTRITTGLRWRWVQPAIVLKGEWQNSWLEDMRDLGEGMAIAIDQGVF